MGEEAAYKLLRKLAIDPNKRIGEVAQEIVTYAKVLEKIALPNFTSDLKNIAKIR